jgi:hypothetical protein
VYAESNMEPLYVLHGQIGGVTQVGKAVVYIWILRYE